MPAPPNYIRPQNFSRWKQVALVISTDGTPQIYVWDLALETMKRLTFDKSSSFKPIWTPDGKLIVLRRIGKVLRASIAWQPMERAMSGNLVLQQTYI